MKKLDFSSLKKEEVDAAISELKLGFSRLTWIYIKYKNLDLYWTAQYRKVSVADIKSAIPFNQIKPLSATVQVRREVSIILLPGFFDAELAAGKMKYLEKNNEDQLLSIIKELYVYDSLFLFS